MRSHLGLDPYAHPAADRAMVLTPTGYVPIETNVGGAGAATNASSQNNSGHVVKNFNPNQPRVPAGNPDGGQWTGDGGAHSSSGSAVQYAAGRTRPVIDPRALTGIEHIDETTKKLAQILANTIDELGVFLDSPQKYGILVHKLFAINVLLAGIQGIGPLDVEASFGLPPGYDDTKSSIKPDVVLRNYVGDIIAMYDVKTGEEGVEPWREGELRAATGVGPDVPIIVLHLRSMT
jgi:hypothetical protein